MKVLVLLAGMVGVLGFFQPFFEYDKQPISAYRIVRGTHVDGGTVVHRVLHMRDPHSQDWDGREFPETGDHTSPVPFYFASAFVMILVALVAFAMRRLSGFAALFSLAAGMLAIGGYLNEVRIDREVVRAGFHAMLTSGASLLLVSGLLGFAASLVVLIKREPDRRKPPPKPPEINLPEARLISG
jgi:hypothetical protein